MSNSERVEFNGKRRYRAFTRLIAPQDPDWLAAHSFGLDISEITNFDPPCLSKQEGYAEGREHFRAIRRHCSAEG